MEKVKAALSRYGEQVGSLLLSSWELLAFSCVLHENVEYPWAPAHRPAFFICRRSAPSQGECTGPLSAYRQSAKKQQYFTMCMHA